MIGQLFVSAICKKGRDGNVTTVRIKLLIRAHSFDNKFKPIMQYKYLTRGIQNISALDAADK